ncbi:MAG: hypothetical protein WB729_14645 [Candidatus Sulfotelmatobacter sp.]
MDTQDSIGDTARRLAQLAPRDNSVEAWGLRFVLADAIEAQGRVEDALQFLESHPAPDAAATESWATLKMYQGSYTGYLGRYSISYRLFDVAEAIARNADLLFLLGDVHLARAFVLFRQKEHAASECQYRCVLELSEKVDGWHLRGHGLWGIGKNLMIQRQYREALGWLDSSLAIFEEFAYPVMIATVWSELGLCHLALGDDVKAMELLRKAERLDLECGSRHNYQVVLADIGNVYLHRREYLTAVDY